MSLRAAIAADASRVFLNTSEFAETASYLVRGAGSPLSCSVNIDEQPQLVVGGAGGTEDGRRWSLSCDSAVITAPDRGDTFSVATGEHAGLFTVESISGRDVGMYTLICKRNAVREAGGQGARQVKS